MRIKTSVFALALVMCAVFNLCGQPASAQTWTLPQGTAEQRTTVLAPAGLSSTTTRRTPKARCCTVCAGRGSTRGLAGGEVIWKNVTQADADRATARFGAAQKRDFMEGFR